MSHWKRRWIAFKFKDFIELLLNDAFILLCSIMAQHCGHYRLYQTNPPYLGTCWTHICLLCLTSWRQSRGRLMAAGYWYRSSMLHLFHLSNHNCVCVCVCVCVRVRVCAPLCVSKNSVWKETSLFLLLFVCYSFNSPHWLLMQNYRGR